MLNKTKLGLTAAATLFSLSAFAAEEESLHRHGFYVEIEGGGIKSLWDMLPLDAEAKGAITQTFYQVTFCEKEGLGDTKAGHDCVSRILTEERPAFIHFHHKNAYLKSLIAIEGTSETVDAANGTFDLDLPHVSLITFNRPFSACSIDSIVRATGDAFGGLQKDLHQMTGYPMLEITLGDHEEEQDEFNNVVNCDNSSIYFPVRF
jgi:hypothetical protein